MTKSTITREESIQAVFDLKVGYTLGLADIEILKRVARMALAAMDSESGCLPLDYLQGHKDGLEWAAQLAEANHPETGDWLYDDPIELAKAIRKGPDMPPAQPAPVVPENYVTAEHRRVIEMLLNVCGAAFELADDSCQQDVDGEDCHVVPDDAFQKLSDALDEIENTLPTEDIDRPDAFLVWSAMPRAALKSLLHAQPAPVVPELRVDWQENEFSAGWNACRAAMLAAAPQPQNAPQNIPEIIPDCWCRTCRPVTLNDMRFVVCPDCGNKRCPRANDHRNACTGSNEPGQEGSAFPDTPREVK